MIDDETIKVYDAKAAEYAKMVERSTLDPALVSFLANVRPGGRVLDLGCGVGNAASVMLDKGFQVDAVDASISMVQLANETHDIGAVQQQFDDLKADDLYDGIWANFSLLHARRADFPRHLKQISKAMKADGYFHIGMKLGDGEIRDSIGRHYAYYSEAELRGYLFDHQFEILETGFGNEPGLSGEDWPWITILSRSNKA
ncbi:MAG: class I SAM-dependent methyltransferase [Salaquimonas sp.]